MSLKVVGRLALRLIMFRRKSAALLIGTAFFATFVAGSVLQVYVHARSAYIQGLVHGRGTPDDSVIQAPSRLEHDLNRQDALLPVATEDGYLNTSSRGIDAVVLTASSTSRIGLTTDVGRLPEASDEVAVSPEVAVVLNLRVNSTVSISGASGSGVARVTGIVVNPGSKDDIAAYRQDQAIAHQHVDYWIVDPVGLAQLEQHEATRPYLDSGALSVSSNSVLISEGLHRMPPRLQLLSAGIWISCGTAVLALISILVNLTKPARRDVRNLTASGLDCNKAWALNAGCAAILVAIGACLGGLSAAMTLAGQRERAGDWFNQYWSDHSASSGGLAAVGLLVIAVVPFFTASWYIVSKISSSETERTKRGRAAQFATSAAFVLVGAALLSGYFTSRPKGGMAVLTGVTGVVLLLHGSGPALTRICQSFLPRATGRLVAEIGSRRRVSLTLGCAVSALAAGYVVATVTPTATAGAGTPGLQPPSSLLVLQVPDTELTEIINAYREFGGQEPMVYGIPISKFGDVRASPTQAETATPGGLFFVAFDAELAQDSVVVSPELSSGPIEIAAYAESDVGKRVTIKGTQDSRLGGNLPGALVAPHGPVAREFGMRPSGFSLLAFFDFDDLQAVDEARMRSLIARVAPAAIVSHADDADPAAQDRATGLLVSLIGSMVAVAAALAGLLSSGVALRGVRRACNDLGYIRALRRKMTSAIIAVELTPVACVVMFLGFSMQRPFHLSFNDGLVSVWVLPLFCQSVLIFVTATLFFHVRSQRDHRGQR